MLQFVPGSNNQRIRTLGPGGKLLVLEKLNTDTIARVIEEHSITDEIKAILGTSALPIASVNATHLACIFGFKVVIIQMNGPWPWPIVQTITFTGIAGDYIRAGSLKSITASGIFGFTTNASTTYIYDLRTMSVLQSYGQNVFD